MTDDKPGNRSSASSRSGPIPPDVSVRITLLRFPLIVGIVLIHAYGLAMRFSGGAIRAEASPTVLFIQNFLSQVVARTAVPLFFAISGLLYFAGFDFSRDAAKRKLSSRVSTLLIPYVAWNAIMILVFFAMQAVPSLDAFFSGQHKPVSEFGLWDYANAFIGFGKGPFADQLWFIRDLMILVLLAPSIGWIVRRAPAFTIGLLMALWMFNKNTKIFELITCDGFFFFFMGAAVAMARWNPCRIDRYGRWLTVIYLAFGAVDAALMTLESPTAALKRSPTYLFHLLLMLVGMAWIWYLAGRWVEHPPTQRVLRALAPLAFFVFAAHEPLLSGIRKLMYKAIVPPSTLEATFVYLAAPVLAISITLAVGWTFRRLQPRLYGLLTGGRS